MHLSINKCVSELLTQNSLNSIKLVLMLTSTNTTSNMQHSEMNLCNKITRNKLLCKAEIELR